MNRLVSSISQMFLRSGGGEGEGDILLAIEILKFSFGNLFLKLLLPDTFKHCSYHTDMLVFSLKFRIQQFIQQFQDLFIQAITLKTTVCRTPGWKS